jgi:Transcription elongation factor, GreA/GreB, C-term
LTKNIADKKMILFDRLLAAIDEKCAMLRSSVSAVVDAATNTESKPENKYDTRALEASYLAGAQQERLDELKGMRRVLSSTELKSFEDLSPLTSTAVVELDCDGTVSWCFLLPFAAGYTLDFEANKKVNTVSIDSPLGQALIGKYKGDFVSITVAGKEREYEILSYF